LDPQLQRICNAPSDVALSRLDPPHSPPHRLHLNAKQAGFNGVPQNVLKALHLSIKRTVHDRDGLTGNSVVFVYADDEMATERVREGGYVLQELARCISAAAVGVAL
jgi:hypothetical protein